MQTDIELNMAIDPVIKRLINFTYNRGLADLPDATIETALEFFRAPKSKVYPHDASTGITSQGIAFDIIRPQGVKGTLPGLIYIRGCSYIGVGKEQAVAQCSLLAHKLGIAIIFPHYRTPPQYRHPVYLDDVKDVALTVQANPNRYQLVANNLGIWGDSSGGNMATIIAKELECLKYQVLLYPMLDLVNDYPSKQRYKSGFMLDQAFIERLIDWTLQKPADRILENVSPLMSQDFSQLPPTLLVSAEFDPFLDENLAYVKRLKEAKVPTWHIHAQGLTHAFMAYYHKIKSVQVVLDETFETVKSTFLCKEKVL